MSMSCEVSGCLDAGFNVYNIIQSVIFTITFQTYTDKHKKNIVSKQVIKMLKNIIWRKKFDFENLEGGNDVNYLHNLSDDNLFVNRELLKTNSFWYSDKHSRPK